MIEIREVSKSFDGGRTQALKNLSMKIDSGRVFGLIGTNGAGKSTLFRVMAGVIRPDAGNVLYNGKALYEDVPSAEQGQIRPRPVGYGIRQNLGIRQQICFLPDAWNMPLSMTPDDCAAQYAVFYPDFRRSRFEKLADTFGFDRKKPVRTFSKGMRKAVMIFLGLSTGTKFLFCDELFDGLDAVVRQTMKSVFAEEMIDRDFTPVISSHNMRELEDFCDHVGLMHKGKVLLSEDLEQMKLNMHKVQFVLRDAGRLQRLQEELDVISVKKRGSVTEMIARGSAEEIMAKIRQEDPVFAETVPVTLEEAFIGETEEKGYDFSSLF